jgi:hypothetical protein
LEAEDEQSFACTLAETGEYCHGAHHLASAVALDPTGSGAGPVVALSVSELDPLALSTYSSSVTWPPQVAGPGVIEIWVTMWP